jgi:hypothetical protein
MKESSMLNALLCYHDGDFVNSWTKEEDDAVLAKRAKVTDKLGSTCAAAAAMSRWQRTRRSPISTMPKRISPNASTIRITVTMCCAFCSSAAIPICPRNRSTAIFIIFGVKGGLLMQLGRTREARVAFDRAVVLAHTPAEAAHIRLHLDRLMKEGQSA